MPGEPRRQVAQRPRRSGVAARVARPGIGGEFVPDHHDLFGREPVEQDIGPIGLVVAQARPSHEHQVLGGHRPAPGPAGSGRACERPDRPSRRRRTPWRRPRHGDAGGARRRPGRAATALGRPDVLRPNPEEREYRDSVRRESAQDHVRPRPGQVPLESLGLAIPPPGRQAADRPEIGQEQEDHSGERDESVPECAGVGPQR